MIRKGRTKAVPREGPYWLIDGTASNMKELARIIEQRTFESRRMTTFLDPTTIGDLGGGLVNE